MSLDERIEALTRSVALLASMHRDHERDFAEHKRLVNGAITSIAQTNESLKEANRGIVELLIEMRKEQREDRRETRELLRRLSVIAEAHDAAIDDHERRLSESGR